MTHTTTLRRLAVGAALAAATLSAHAQVETSAFGVLDFSYGRFEPSGTIHRNRFNSNSLSASFVGFNLKDGLDGGWTPGITLETFLRFQEFRTGRSQKDPLFSRNAFVSLASPYGTVRVGRLQTFLFDTTTRFNALGNSVVFSPAMKHLFTSGNLEGVQGDFYWNRAISYQSPDLDGVRANVMVGRGPKSELEGNYSAANLIVARGLLAVSLSAQRVRINDGIADPSTENTWQLGATYNFGLARVFGLYTQTNDIGLQVTGKTTSAGATVPVGPGTLQAQVAYTTAKGPAVDRRHLSTGAAYLYPYDSQTVLYVVAMDDRVRGQTRGASVAVGVRQKF